LEFVKKVAANINIPFCVGGGVSTIEDFADIMASGADKVAVNSAALKNPELLKEASLKFGSKCVVLAIDAKRNDESSWNVYVKGGRKRIDLDPIEWAVKAVELGVGEIVVNSIDEDGMKNGYDIELLKRIKASVDVPVIASGGAGELKHFYDAIEYANVDGVLAASVFHFGEIKIQELKRYLMDKNIKVML
ncbi:MAG: imidazole glycerol phosphate synthase cyclase subunit, partial [Lutispora sp.]